MEIPSGHFEVEFIKLTIVLFNRTLREKAELEQMIVDGVSKLKTSITSLHRRLCTDKPQSERTRSTLTLNGVADERKNIDILINKIIQIEESADLLDEKNRRLGLLVDDVWSLKSTMYQSRNFSESKIKRFHKMIEYLIYATLNFSYFFF